MNNNNNGVKTTPSKPTSLKPKTEMKTTITTTTTNENNNHNNRNEYNNNVNTLLCGKRGKDNTGTNEKVETEHERGERRSRRY